ncbi:DUF4065 domain-containing protein [Leptospira fletcheri]|uniref:DUF4065 domain-containing protein n=1 Tax=Leptospira fletcheri TaxID=2484981 RepID=A0A4R9GFD6_9LEPT|nr:type II toxin-antitoxin system antitoxin SocA domain-containing protein [Leptospira fletcheri]TGK11360.1 DUF4065 domain-containing protein [Leptospira fletcheri]
MVVSVFDVAKYILEYFEGKDISTFKLQKLCYYSQAWSLVWDDESLFNEKILAWANGPVIRELYDYHKGNFSINSKRFRYAHGNLRNLSKEQKLTIDAVLNAYGNLSGQQLSQLTHNERPWSIAREGLSAGERGERIITLDSMVEYYSALYHEQLSKKDKNTTSHKRNS